MIVWKRELVGWKTAVWLAATVLGFLFLFLPPPVYADGVPTIEYMPLYARGGGDTDTPFVIYLTVSDLNENTTYQFRTLLRQGSGDSGSYATAAEGNFEGIDYKTLGTTASDCGTNCSLAIWSYMRGTANTAAGPSQIRVRVRVAGATEPPPLHLFTGPTFLDMENNGGWLEENTGVARDGHAVAVYDQLDLVGLYVAKLNGVNDGYANEPGYYRLAVPDCTDCGYTIETWAIDNPGTAVGHINRMGEDGCPGSIDPGSVQLLNSCNTPTAVSLTTFTSSNAGIIPLVLLLLVLLTATGLSLWRRW
jgi:hypothetical protein